MNMYYVWAVHFLSGGTGQSLSASTMARLRSTVRSLSKSGVKLEDVKIELIAHSADGQRCHTASFNTDTCELDSHFDDGTPVPERYAKLIHLKPLINAMRR